jgi:hypothetical protein
MIFIDNGGIATPMDLELGQQLSVSSRVRSPANIIEQEKGETSEKKFPRSKLS